MTEIRNGNSANVQGLSVAVDTHRQHSLEGLVAVLDAARGLTVVCRGRPPARRVPARRRCTSRPRGASSRRHRHPDRSRPRRCRQPRRQPRRPRRAREDRRRRRRRRRRGPPLRAALRDVGVDDSYVITEPGRRTVVKRRLVAEGQLIARFDEGDRTPPAPAVLAELGRHAHRLEHHADAVVVSDYGYGALGEPVVRALAPARRRGRGALIVDAHDPAAFAVLHPTAVTPSFGEVAPLLPQRSGTPGPGAR